MEKINVFISHRWNYPEDYEKISGALDRSKFEVSDRSVTEDSPLNGNNSEVWKKIKGKIDSASIILVPARPAATTAETVGKKEIDYAIEQNKTIIAIDTHTTTEKSSFWAENNIPVVDCNKRSIEKAIGV